MQHIQDREFDQLFKDRFEDAEIQPSAHLWNNISAELVPKRKRVLPAYWMAAAVVLLAITVGLLMPKTEKIKLKAPIIAAASTDAADNISTDRDIAEIKAKGPSSGNAVTSVASLPAGDDSNKSTPLIIAPRFKPVKSDKNNLIAMQPKQQDVHHNTKQPEIVNEPLKAVPEPKNEPVNEMMIAKAEVPDQHIEDVIAATGEADHTGIRNVGDLVNFVVNKVDKREKKFIQFDTNDDNSSLVSLNIGFIKFNKRSDR